MKKALALLAFVGAVCTVAYVGLEKQRRVAGHNAGGH